MSDRNVFVKISNDRDDRFCTVTRIRWDQGKKYVLKEPENAAAEAHVRNIVRNGRILSQRYQNSRIRFASCTKLDEGVRIEWIEGNSFAEYLDSLLANGEVEACLHCMEEYFENICSLEKHKYRRTPDCELIFEVNGLAEPVMSVNGADVDMLFQNVIYSESEHIWTDYDYEWVLNCDIPVKFLVYRCLNYYLTTEERVRLLGAACDQRFDISEEEREVFAVMEAQLQSYIAGNVVPLRIIYEKIGGSVIQVRPLAERNIRNRRAEVFFDTGKGFDPAESETVQPEEYAPGRFHIRLKYPAGTNAVRFDPAQSGCVLWVEYVRDSEGREILFSTNGWTGDDNMYLFLHSDPQISFSVSRENESVEIGYRIAIIDAENASCEDVIGRYQHEMSSRITDLNNELANVKSQNSNLACENTDLAQQNAKLQENFDQARREYLLLTESTSWRLTEPFRKIGQIRFRAEMKETSVSDTDTSETEESVETFRMEGNVDHVYLDRDKVRLQGWKIGFFGKDAGPQKTEIDVRDETDHPVVFQRKDIVRKDANDIFLKPEDIGFESGFELEWDVGDHSYFTVNFRVGDQTENYKADILHLRFLEREKSRHFKNRFDMLLHGDRDMREDRRYCIRTEGRAAWQEYLKRRFEAREAEYAAYFNEHRPSAEILADQRKHKFQKETKISIVVPTYNTPKKYLIEMIDSVVSQTYSNWELCIADGSEGNSGLEKTLRQYHKKDPRIRYKINEKNLGISGNTNEALSLATGDYIGLLDHDDILGPDALYEAVSVMNAHDDADAIYTDEDKIAEDISDHFGPAFKPDFNLDLLRSNNYICHFFVVKKAIVDKIHGFRPEFDGSQDFDFIFRCVEQARQVYHIPKILYYWRCHPNSVAGNPESKLYAYEAGRKAIEEHLCRTGEPDALVERLPYWGLYRVTYPVKRPEKVSILIPNKDHTDDLRRCVNSILEKTTYQNYDIFVVENNSAEPQTFDYYRELEQDERITVLYWDREFNYSAINNFAAEHCDGRYLVFLNNDTEVITENWLEKMLGNCQRAEVGAVGAKLYFADDTVQHAGVVLGLGGIAGHVLVGEKRESLGYCAKAQIQQDYSAVTAACMMMSRQLFEEVQGFDEELSVAFNDVDLCLKVRAKDLLIVFDPNIELYHYESQSRGLETTYEKQKRFQKEGEYMKEKWKETLEKEDPYYNCNFTLSESDFSLRK